jgi:hypothetical protein
MNKSNLLVKLPSAEQLVQVFAAIAVINYSWSLLQFFYRLPSWLFYASMGEIGVKFSYMTFVNLLESLLLLALFVLAGLVLPRAWFRERFVSRSVSISLLGLGYLMYVNLYFPLADSYPLASYARDLTVLLVIAVLAFLMDRVAFLRSLLDGFANRTVVFLYLIVPVSVVSLLVVLFRNLF